MLNQSGFDLWADGYDRSVGLSDLNNAYPFAGYKTLLARIYEIVLKKSRPAVLDLGFGTGVLTAKLYEAGCRVYGQDFSPRMIELAQEKMPKAVLVQGDLSEGLSPALRDLNCDFILSTYALHHLDSEEKTRLIQALQDRLKPGGLLLIGDVAFQTREELEACRTAAGAEWDEDEIYFVYDEIKTVFPEMRFERISHCAGLLIWEKDAVEGAEDAEACNALGQTTPPANNAAEDLQLYIPKPEDGWFYIKMLSDPATMSYNAPWFPPDGCIPFSEAEWTDMCETWIGREPQRFYAFLRRRSDGSFVGDVNFHYSEAHDWWDMGVLVYAPERGKGYGRQGIRLLLDRAFRTAGISRLHNEFETTRDAAYRIHKAAGFRETRIQDGIIHLELTREEYLAGEIQ